MNNSRKVQLLTLNLLKKFISFCEENNLTYYFTGGALIGVKRHSGFIPWDDDIDLGMPRRDYDRFVELAKKSLSDGYGICDRFTNNTWHFAMSQFIDLESEIEIHLSEKPRKANVWLDIFPLDGLPSNCIFRWLHVKYILVHRYLVQMLYVKEQANVVSNRPFIERIILSTCRMLPLNRIFNVNKILDHLEKVLRKYDFNTSEYCGNMLGRYREREVVKTSWFGKPVLDCFENIKVYIPEYSHEILTSLYGDYMQLPPKNSRIAHNVKIEKSRKIDGLEGE